MILKEMVYDFIGGRYRVCMVRMFEVFIDWGFYRYKWWKGIFYVADKIWVRNKNRKVLGIFIEYELFSV